MDFELSDRRILVTGATSGIGLETARLLHEQGAQLVLMGRQESVLKGLADELKARTFTLDIADNQAVEDAFAAMPPLDGLVNCAGITRLADALTFEPADLDALLTTNVRAAAMIARETARNMITNRRAGSIVNVSSQASLVALEGHLGYCASKAAMDATTRVLCLELGAHGIRVNSVNPTVTLTPMAELAWSDPAKREPMLAKIPLRRFASPREIALPIACLLSPAGAMISGISLPIDGGYTAH